MAYVDLQLVKRHLNIESSFNEDDSYLELLIETGEENVAKDLCVSVEELETIDGGTKIPAPLRQAILLTIGTYYNNRESVSSAKLQEIPRGAKYLTELYRNYTL